MRICLFVTGPKTNPQVVIEVKAAATVMKALAVKRTMLLSARSRQLPQTSSITNVNSMIQLSNCKRSHYL